MQLCKPGSQRGTSGREYLEENVQRHHTGRGQGPFFCLVKSPQREVFHERRGMNAAKQEICNRNINYYGNKKFSNLWIDGGLLQLRQKKYRRHFHSSQFLLMSQIADVHMRERKPRMCWASQAMWPEEETQVDWPIEPQPCVQDLTISVTATAACSASLRSQAPWNRAYIGFTIFRKEQGRKSTSLKVRIPYSRVENLSKKDCWAGFYMYRCIFHYKCNIHSAHPKLKWHILKQSQKFV